MQPRETVMRKTPSKGIFITVEGPDGSGKSTQVDLLVTFLRDQQHRVLVTREPGGTGVGEAIRKILLEPARGNHLADEAELFLFAAARAQHVREVILPALSQGQIVIASRYLDATVAYQGYGRNLPLDTIRIVNNLATGGLTPDMTIILDVEAETGLHRAKGTDKDTPSGEMDRIEAAGIDFHRRVRQGYFAIAAAEPGRCIVMDGGKPIAEVAAQIQHCLKDRFAI